jgi:hypothetical protein
VFTVTSPLIRSSSPYSIPPTTSFKPQHCKSSFHHALDHAQTEVIMSALLAAPEELLDTITTHLAQADILSLARTCKALRHSMTPRIFRAISMTWDADKSRHSAPRITSLLRALVNRPDDAANIEHVELQARNYEPYERRDHDIEGRPTNCSAYRLLESDKPAFVQDLTRMGLRDVNSWLTAIFVDNDLRALMAVLLMRCTRLKSLNMASELFLTPSMDRGTWLPSMLDRCLSTPASSDRGGLSRFDRLTSVIITGPLKDVGRKIPEDVVKCLFQIPSLVTLDIACCPDLSTGINEDVKPEVMAGCAALDRLAVLRLPCADAFPRTLKALLRFAPNLRTLVYDVLMDNGAFPNEDLADALATLPETLEELTIRVHMYVREAMDLSSLVLPLHGGGIGPLQRLRNLRSLTIPLSILFGHDPLDEVVPQLADFLPRSLELLNLVGDFGAFDSATMHGPTVEAILRSLLAGEERVDNRWNHMCWHGDCDRGRDCEPVWAYRAAPRWKSSLPRLQRITIIENDSGYYGGEGTVLDKDRCEALNEMVSSQGLELVHVEVDDYKGVRF